MYATSAAIVTCTGTSCVRGYLSMTERIAGGEKNEICSIYFFAIALAICLADDM